MCQCDPRTRTPFCGKGSCVWPAQLEEQCKRPSCDNTAFYKSDIFVNICQSCYDELEADYGNHDADKFFQYPKTVWQAMIKTEQDRAKAWMRERFSKLVLNEAS